jgi:glycosyltransferase involved in cell wall biosynthesis
VVASELAPPRTGVGRYLGDLLAGVCTLELDWQWRLHLPGEPFEHPLWTDPRMTPCFHRSRRSATLWELLELPRRLTAERPDLVFAPAYSLPPRLPAPGVVTLHDLSFECRPGEFRWRERWRRRLLARSASRRAARVLVVSPRIAAEIAAAYAVAPVRIAVVPVPFEAAEWSAAASGARSDALAGLGIAPPYLLFLGSLLERRGLDLMLAVLAALRRERRDLALVLAGADRLTDPGRLERRLAETGLTDAVVRPGWVPEPLLPALYRHAEASLYLSSYEGFGIPPLESLACGTPAVTAPGLALDGLWPDLPWRAAALEPEAVIVAVRRAVAEQPDPESLSAEACARFAPLARAAVARRLVAELEEAAS